MSSIDIFYDSSQVPLLNTQKSMVAVPLFYIFLVHYTFQAFRFIKGLKQVGPLLNDLGRRITLFGVASLFSLNFVQSCTAGTIISWVSLIVVVVAHCFIFVKETSQRHHNMVLLVYYLLLLVWFSLIIYYLFDNSQGSSTSSTATTGL